VLNSQLVCPLPIEDSHNNLRFGQGCANQKMNYIVFKIMEVEFNEKQNNF
jgi:hypothetical protein